MSGNSKKNNKSHKKDLFRADLIGRHVVLCDRSDRVTGVADLIWAHQKPAKHHRAISFFLFDLTDDQDPKLLMQQRSLTKITAGGEWGNTLCGNMSMGESAIETLHSRLKIELGWSKEDVSLINPELIYQFNYQMSVNRWFGENENDRVLVSSFKGNHDKIVRLSEQFNHDEVSNLAWVSWREILKQASAHSWLTKIVQSKTAIIDTTDNYTSSGLSFGYPTLILSKRFYSIDKRTIVIDQKLQTVFTWFVLMVGNSQLVNKINAFLAKQVGKRKWQ